MSQNSSIEWTEATWNPVTGCTKISPGCKHCYAERMAKRLKAMEQPRYRNGFEVTIQQDLLDLPLKWKAPKIVFVNSMSDLFHKDIPDRIIIRCFETMVKATQHTFQVLTKRPERAARMASLLPWPNNLWLGTSVEHRDYYDRIRELSKTPAKIKFLSLEPLLAPLHRIPLRFIDWVIAGGESGPNARPIEIEWVRSIRDQCTKRGVSFFFKQWGGVQKSKTGRLLDGRTWNEMPLIQRGDDGKKEKQRSVA